MRIASTSCVVEAASGCAAEIDLLLTDIVKPVDFQGLSRAMLQLNLNWALLEPAETNAPNVRA